MLRKIKQNVYFLVKSTQFELKKMKRILLTREMPKKSLTFQGKQNTIAITAIIKNEAPYILEWIEYHRLIGVSKFYLFDNDSDDDLQNVLKPYIDEEIVVLEKLSGKKQQLHAYELGVKKARNEVQWLAVLDLDEFINIGSFSSIQNFLSTFDSSKVSEILLRWRIFGSNGMKHYDDELVIKRFTRRGVDDTMLVYKAIVNPRRVLDFLHPHYAFVTGKVVDGDGKTIHYYPVKEDKYLPNYPMNKVNIHHYYSKSFDEFLKKSQRGFADGVEEKRSARSRSDFEFYDRNEVFDDSMVKYVSEISKRIRSLPKVLDKE